MSNMGAKSANDAAFEWGLATLAHSIEALAAAAQTGRAIAMLGSTSIFDHSIDALRRPGLTHNMARHALSLVTLMAQWPKSMMFPDIVYPSGLFTAMTRSEDMGLRAIGFHTLLALSWKKHITSWDGDTFLPPSDPPHDLTPDILPPDVWESIQEYGNHGLCETSLR